MFAYFLIGLAFLVYFAYLDLFTGEIENRYILLFLALAILISVLNQRASVELPIMVLAFAGGWYLWKKDVWGGADVKILPCVIPFLQVVGLPNILIFIMILALTTLAYQFVAKLVTKREYLPYVPVFLFSFIVFRFFQYRNAFFA